MGMEELYDYDGSLYAGLARECPKCHVIDHYDIRGRKPVEVRCKCGHCFIIQKYKRGEKPKAKKITEQ